MRMDMQPTRRYWGLAGLSGFLAVLAVLFSHALLLVGAAFVGAWLLTHQYRFYQDMIQITDTVEIEQTLARDHITTGEPLPVTLAVARSDAASIVLEIEINPPIVAEGTTRSDRTLELTSSDQKVTTSIQCSFPVAGAFTFEPPTVTAADAHGLLRERFTIGSAATLRVEPRGPRNIHVGEGGEQMAAAYGDHPAGRLGIGLDPAELREYVPGDAADRIDWKATARLAEPYVREYEAETDRRTALVVDHRASLSAGQPGETKLDFLRQIALAFVAIANKHDDPLGYYTIGDGGLTGHTPPTATQDQYETIRTRLHDLTPTNPNKQDHTNSGDAPLHAPSTAHRIAARLEDDRSSFGTTLRPFFQEAETYVRRISGDPLFETVRHYLTDLEGRLLTVIFTDDTQRSELRETVKLARRGDDQVLVFLTPTVLFEPASLSDLEEAYDRYADFEAYRRGLVSLSRVTACEVAPRDRLDTVLESDQTTRRQSHPHL